MQEWVRLGVDIVGMHPRSVMMTREKDGKVSFRPTLCTVKQGTDLFYFETIACHLNIKRINIDRANRIMIARRQARLEVNKM